MASETLDKGHYNEVVTGTFVLGKLIQMEDVYDFKFGMERREDFPKFDDIAVGIQNKEEDQMHYYVFQLKGSETKKSFGPGALFSELAIFNSSKKNYVDYLLEKFYKEILKKVKSREGIETINRVKNFVICTQYKYDGPDSNEDCPINVLQEGTIGEEYAELLSLLPNISDQSRQFLTVDSSKIRNILPQLFSDNQESAIDFENYLKKVLIIASSPRPEKTNQAGLEMYQNDIWDRMKIRVHNVRYNAVGNTTDNVIRAPTDPLPWITRKELLSKNIAFQGYPIEIGTILGNVDSSTLCQLLFAPENISIGKIVQGFDDVHYHIAREFKQAGSAEVKTEEYLLKERIVIIEGEPGLGKTETLRHAADCLKKDSLKNKVNVWVAEVRLADLSRVFEKLRMTSTKQLSVERAIEILTELTMSDDDHLGKKCFQLALDNNLPMMSVCLFLDGLDEVSNKWYNLALHWIRQLVDLKSISSLWVSTRKYLKSDVERTFDDLKSHTMVRFERRHQKKLFEKLWNVEDNESERFDKFAANLLRELEHKVASIESIIGLPLITMMVAEVFEGQFRSSNDLHGSIIVSHVSLLSLFEHFIEKTFKRHHKKYFDILANDSNFKQVVDLLRDAYVSEHSLLSLHHLYGQFPDLHCVLTDQECNQLQIALNKIKKSGDYVSGLLVNSTGATLHFIHQTFAEYFSAKWLFDRMSRLDMEDKKFKKLSQHASEIRIQGAENRHNASLNDLSSNQLEELKGFMQTHFAKEDSDNVRIFFAHMAVSGNDKHTESLRRILTREEVDAGDLTTKGPTGKSRQSGLVLDLQPIHLSWMFNNFEYEHLHLLQGSEDLLRNDWTLMLLYEVLDYAASAQNHEVVDLLLGIGADEKRVDTGKRMSLVEACEYDDPKMALNLIASGDCVNQADEFWNGNTPLHIASVKGHESLVEILIEKGAIVDRRNDSQETPLHVACENGHLDVVEVLLEHGANVNRDDYSSETPLYKASANNKWETVKFLIRNRAELETAGSSGMTPLLLACENGYEEISKLLIERGVDVNRPDPDGLTPLHKALANEHYSISKMLIRKGAGIQITIDSKVTPLEIACEIGDVELAQLLLEKGAEASIGNSEGVTYLHKASRNGFREIAEILIRSGAEVDKADSSGRTALHLACENGHLQAVQSLIEKGSDINKGDNRGNAPLHKASGRGYRDIASLLLEHAAQVDRANGHGTTPLHTACRMNHVAVARLLVAKGADVNAAKKGGATPLYTASVHLKWSIAKLLIENGADVNVIDGMGYTPLLNVCRQHPCFLGNKIRVQAHFEIAQLLVDSGGDVNHAIDLRTPLQGAIAFGFQSVAELLVRNGADTNAPDKEGTTPLHMACERGRPEAVKLLADNGANLDAVDKRGRTPLDIARENGHLDIVRMLTASRA